MRAEIREEPVAAGVALTRRGDAPHHWYGVMSGSVKWSMTTADGQSITFGGASPGSWFGEGTMLRATFRPADVIALQPSRVAMMGRDTFEWLYQSERSFSHFLLQQLSERMFWYMESWAADRVLNAEGQVKRALAGLFHPALYPRGPVTSPFRRKRWPTLRAFRALVAIGSLGNSSNGVYSSSSTVV